VTPPSSPRSPVVWEILIVLGLSAGRSAAYALVSLIDKLTRPAPLGRQTTSLNVSVTPDRPWLDLIYQLVGIAFFVVPALLAIYLLRDVVGGPRSALGLTWPGRRVWSDLGTAATLAAVIGIPGLGFYLLTLNLGANTRIAAANLPDVWWEVPVLVLSAISNGILEEIVVVGYLVTRLRDLGWRVPAVVLASALLRGSYHLYQGWGGFIGNVVMGAVFALVFLRTRRVAPLVIAHTLLDVVAFVGYAWLADKVSFL
jgi:uncharacterized protein